MGYDFLRLCHILVLLLSLGIILPAKSLSVGVIEGSGEQLDSVLAPPADKAPILPEYDTG